MPSHDAARVCSDACTKGARHSAASDEQAAMAVRSRARVSGDGSRWRTAHGAGHRCLRMFRQPLCERLQALQRSGQERVDGPDKLVERHHVELGLLSSNRSEATRGQQRTAARRPRRSDRTAWPNRVRTTEIVPGVQLVPFTELRRAERIRLAAGRGAGVSEHAPREV